MNKVDEYFESLEVWKDELCILREITLECGLQEEYKWRTPCYSFHSKNILILAAFKNYSALSFFKGELLKDELKILHSPGENSRSVKLFKFTSVNDILELKDLIKTYIFEAIENEKKGLKIQVDNKDELNFPKEFEEELEANPELKKAFGELTMGRKRAYSIYFSSAKQSKTISARIDKYRSRIMAGKGLNDCVCGLSKRMPNCDGSHKKQ